jgi:diguanylate cyclase (GGDEF)-like protein
MESTLTGLSARAAPKWFAAAVCIALLASAVLHAHLRGRDAAAYQRTACAAVADALAPQFRADAARSDAELQDRCERLIENPSILAASLWSQSGVGLAAAGIAPALIGVTRPQSVSGGVSVAAVDPPASLASHLPALARVEVGLGSHFQERRPARLCLLMAPERLAPATVGHTSGFYAPLAAIALAALFAIPLVWRRSVAAPLEELLEIASGEENPGGRPAVCRRRDDWGLIAHRIVELRGDAGSWQDYARRVERHVDRHLAHATQRMARHLKRIERKSCQDPLTGLANRRLLNDRLPSILSAQRAANADLAAIMLDIDHFKALNDALGHAAGDEILSFVGELLGAMAGREGLAARYGGDEFLLILPGVNVSSALAVAERVIAMFAQRVKMMGPGYAKVSLTAGIATVFQHRPANARDLIVMSDRALYEGKRAGKKGARVYGWSVAAG